MLDFNTRRFCLLMGATEEVPACEPAASSESDDLRLVHVGELMKRSALSAKELMRLVREGALEPPRRLHYRAFAWRSDYVTTWLERRKHLLPRRSGNVADL